jgi:II/X family phage/plasmid replication protein
MLKAGPDVRVQDYWEALLAWAQGKLRWEVELRSRELTRSQLRSLVLWESIEVSSVAIAYTQVVEMPDSDATRVLHLEAYPKHLRKTVALWKAGLDLRAVLPKRTFYRHRKELLEHGIDIAKPFDPAGFKELGPIPVARVPKLSELPLAQPPEWAKATPLMWEPEPIHLRKRVEA